MATSLPEDFQTAPTEGGGPAEGAAPTDAAAPAATTPPAEKSSLAPEGTAHHPAKEKELPPYTRSLLHIRVPISVTLATKRQPVGQIMDLGAGSIIHFDKSCDEMLDLYVGQHRVAKGEAVKVGEKFGLRITSIILPEERFRAVEGR